MNADVHIVVNPSGVNSATHLEPVKRQIPVLALHTSTAYHPSTKTIDAAKLCDVLLTYKTALRCQRASSTIISNQLVEEVAAERQPVSNLFLNKKEGQISKDNQ